MRGKDFGHFRDNVSTIESIAATKEGVQMITFLIIWAVYVIYLRVEISNLAF